MKKARAWIILALFISLLSFQINNNDAINASAIPSFNSHFPLKIAQEVFYKVDIQITAPTGYTLPGNTPIIINLSTLAAEFPTSVDPFGKNTPETSDDVKWSAAYVFHENSAIPSQVDDVDAQMGYSEKDELLFQLPETLNLTSGQSTTFTVYFGTQELDLPDPVFSDACTVYEYTKKEQVAEYFGTDMLGDEVYYIENSKIQACALVEAAWSSGGLYELSVLDEEGNSRWDAIKQRFKEDFETWKWSRFATIEQFVELNDKASTNPFFLTRIIKGPVRAQIQMQSTAPYGKPSSLWGTKPGVYGLVSYDLYANLPYIDYTLDITGPNAAANPTLQIEYQNRDFKPGGGYSPYKWLYIPGVGYTLRAPDDLDVHQIQSNQIAEPWYVEKLKPGETMFPSEPDADKLGFGMIFDDTGLTNIAYEKISEHVRLVYTAAEIPLQTRYFPFDVRVTNDAISYMSQRYQEWIRPYPTLDITVTETQEVPFDYIGVSKPVVTPLWAKVGDKISLSNISATASTIGEINDTVTSTHTYEIADFNTSTTLLTGGLVWDSNASAWEVTDIDLSSLTEDQFYVAQAHFGMDNLLGKSKFSNKFWYGNSDPPIDLTPPSISLPILAWTSGGSMVRSSDDVNVTCIITDDESGVASATLYYFNGTWYNTSMVSEFGQYTGSIPPQRAGKMIKYKITAVDNNENSNTTEEYEYTIALEYIQGQGLIPLVGVSGVLVAAVVIAFLLRGMHRQKYDQV